MWSPAVPVLARGLLSTTTFGGLSLRLSETGTLIYGPHDYKANRLVSVARDGSALMLGLPPARNAFPRLSPNGE